MTSNTELKVWYGEKLVGKLWRDEIGKIGFRYDQSWIKNGFSISQQLPLSIEEYSSASGKAHQFFANLLPEADARIHIVRDLKISNSDFELLKAIGGECAGALSILPADHNISATGSYKQLNNDELKQLLLRKGSVVSLTSSKHRPRLSLAGAQDKCPIFYDGRDYFLPQDASPSTHILKFEISGYRNIPAYECFLTKLAEAVGLPVVGIELKKIDKEYFLLIERYDRILKDKRQVQRLHQEDFCQALGVSYDRKYQQEGGPSFYDCYNLIRQVSTNPLHDIENLLKWQVFNVLAGNSDGHAKNLSFVYNQNHEARLAPFYDLVCTRAIERIDTKLALSVGDEFNPDNITIQHWKILAEQCNIRDRFFKELIQTMAEGLLSCIDSTHQDFQNSYGSYPALQRILMVVQKQCERAMKQLK